MNSMTKFAMGILVLGMGLQTMAQDATAPSDSTAVAIVARPITGPITCSNKDMGYLTKNTLPGEGYWMQACGDCRITYTSHGGIGGQMFNMCTNKKEPITGNIDPYPVPGTDGKIYVHGGQIRFLRIKDALASNGQNQPFFNDQELSGDYESVGLLAGSTAAKLNIRVALGWEQGKYRDYKISRPASGNFDDLQATDIVENGEIRILGPPSSANDIDHQQGTMSRDGTMFSGRDQATQQTEIFKLGDDGSTLTKIASLPAMSSKVSFGYDNHTVYYVVADPNQQNRQRLLQYDTTTQKTRTLSGPDEDVEYMSSRPDGTLLYTRRVAGTSGDSSSDLIKISAAAVTPPANPALYQVLGLLWASHCNRAIDADSAEAIGVRMPKAACDKLVREFHAADFRDDYPRVTAAQLTAVCPSLAPNVQSMDEQGAQ